MARGGTPAPSSIGQQERQRVEGESPEEPVEELLRGIPGEPFLRLDGDAHRLLRLDPGYDQVLEFHDDLGPLGPLVDLLGRGPLECGLQRFDDAAFPLSVFPRQLRDLPGVDFRLSNSQIIGDSKPSDFHTSPPIHEVFYDRPGIAT
jgi:hypothetical protein